MKVFISWSGEVSHSVALALRDWLPNVIQSVEPFVSSEDIDRGARWSIEIGSKLEKVNFGILCITPQNYNAPWILFEAGALSKRLDESRVTPLLIGLKKTDLTGPLAQFNATSIEEDDMLKLVKSINGQLGDLLLNEKKLEQSFKKWWPDLSPKLIEAEQKAKIATKDEKTPSRSENEILEEILELSRGIARQLSKEQSERSIDRLVGEYLVTDQENSTEGVSLRAARVAGIYPERKAATRGLLAQAMRAREKK